MSTKLLRRKARKWGYNERLEILIIKALKVLLCCHATCETSGRIRSCASISLLRQFHEKEGKESDDDVDELISKRRIDDRSMM